MSSIRKLIYSFQEHRKTSSENETGSTLYDIIVSHFTPELLVELNKIHRTVVGVCLSVKGPNCIDGCEVFKTLCAYRSHR